MRPAAPYVLGWMLLAAVYVAISTAGGFFAAQAAFALAYVALGTGAWVGLVTLDQVYVENKASEDLRRLVR